MWAFICGHRVQPGKAPCELPERCVCIWRPWEPKGFHLCTWHGPALNFPPHFCPLPVVSTRTCVQASQEGGEFILHKQFSLWPLLECANQVANSDTDTCPFGTGMKTATHFLETIKHPVREQQLSINCNLGETRTGHTDSQLPILPAIPLPSD